MANRPKRPDTTSKGGKVQQTNKPRTQANSNDRKRVKSPKKK